MSEAVETVRIEVSRVREAAERFIANVGEVIVGKKDVIELVMVSLFSEGHVLLEDVPGIGKTMLARATARSLGCRFKRIQCTPDLLPSDVTGIHYFNQKTSEFEFRPGPIMANIVLVDEINRATPRTQACLLECMQEQQVTVDLDTVSLQRPFLIIATQNPVELEGTFPLPEAQLDRFLLRIRIGYPSQEEERDILSRFQRTNPLDSLGSVIGVDELLELQELCRQVYVEESVCQYVTAITRATREHQDISLGASPRASMGLHLASQVLAAIRGRDYVIPDDVKHVAVPVLAHRLIVNAGSRLKGQSGEAIVKDIISAVPVPVEKQA
ncbi:MAG: MoxR family ATPase [Dehalococcoidia bacterium]|nr:MoxR family ATPase [Dehalococcoidia bacterium]